eukprot:931285-Pyramimonas_sp.AAC.1
MPSTSATETITDVTDVTHVTTPSWIPKASYGSVFSRRASHRLLNFPPFVSSDLKDIVPPSSPPLTFLVKRRVFYTRCSHLIATCDAPLTYLRYLLRQPPPAPPR